MVEPLSEAMANPQSDSLADHAATAALHEARSSRQRPTSDVVNTGKSVIYTDGYRPARPASSSEVAPPISGGLNMASAGAAASIAHTKYKPVEPWRPQEQPAAGKAALHAHRHMYESSGHPESDSKQRAFAAAFPKVQRPEARYSAAEKVMTEGPVQNGYIPTQDKSARSAAAGAMSGGSQRGSDAAANGSHIMQRKDSHAMSAAVKSHRLSQAGGTIPEEQNVTIEGSRTQGYRSAPRGVTAEMDDKLKHEDTRHAAVVSMARQMYTVTTELNGDHSPGASRQASRTGRPRMSSQPGLSTGSESMPYRYPANLHDHAQRLAAQRMSSLYDEHQAYRDYYGVTSPSRSRSHIDRFRRRSSSDSDASNFDRQRSRRIRSEMSIFANRIDEVDSQRERDRAFLMEVAKRNVELEMKHLDERVCAETGRPSPALVEAWEGKARERLESGDGHIDTSGKVAVGGGRYAERSDVHSLAKGRLQSTFDDIKERAEEERARMIEERLDEEERQRLASIEKEREADMEEARRHMQELEKQEAKAEKARRAERDRREKEDHRLWKRKSKESKGKEPATDDSVSPEVSATSQEPETYRRDEGRGRAVAFSDHHRYGEDPSRMKNGEPSRAQPSPIREEESVGSDQIKREPSPTPSETKSDAERLREWLKKKKRRTSADKSASPESSRVAPEKEEVPKKVAQRDDTPVMGAGAAGPEQAPGVTDNANTEGPGHATALRSHPVTNGDMPEGGTSGGKAGAGAVSDQPANVHDAANAEESGAKAQNRRSKRWSFNRILGFNGKNNAGEETGGPVATAAERGDDNVLQGPPRTTDTKTSESIIRDSRFVENL